MIKKVVGLLLVLLVAFSSTVFAANWEFVGDATDGKWYVDTTSLRYSRSYMGIDKNVIDAWVKIELSQSRKEEKKEIAKGLKLFNKKWNSLTHQLAKYRFRIDTHELAIVYVADYNSDGDVLFSNSYTPKFASIPPGTIGENLFDWVIAGVEFNTVK